MLTHMIPQVYICGYVYIYVCIWRNKCLHIWSYIDECGDGIYISFTYERHREKERVSASAQEYESRRTNVYLRENRMPWATIHNARVRLHVCICVCAGVRVRMRLSLPPISSPSLLCISPSLSSCTLSLQALLSRSLSLWVVAKPAAIVRHCALLHFKILAFTWAYSAAKKREQENGN